MIKSKKNVFREIKDNAKYLDIPDVTNQLFLILLGLISLIFIESTAERILIPLVNIFFCILIIYFVSHYEKKPELSRRERSFTRFLRFWYPGFMIFFCFKEIYYIMINANKNLYDNYLIDIDRWLFGTDPAVFLSHYIDPFAVEFLQIAYGFFYVMPLIYAMELYFWHRYEELKYASFVIFFGFYLSFIGYMLIPAIGPRFTIFNFSNIDMELPGLFAAKFIRDVINFGESIPYGVADPENYAQRDAFPSGHTLIVLLITYLSHKIKSNSFYFYLPYSIILIFSTVYLRYHYVIDLIAAVPIAMFTIWTANKLYKGKINFGKLPRSL
ncbi:MAG: phosphatase PAP2 family protein [Ignavibacteria bacterium]|nr:phosphatase PAP2 family protein [Ignavibacteria bacterium]